MRFRFPSFVILAVAFAAAAFASREKPVIGLSLDTLKEERWQRDRDTFIAEAKKLGAEVIVQSANSDDTRQTRDIESLITRKVDVLVVVPHNGAALARAMKSAVEAKIPVIAYDRLSIRGSLQRTFPASPSCRQMRSHAYSSVAPSRSATRSACASRSWRLK